ncbi:hypothetical protein M413DRAFT_442068 [Hebeloma cylindrosporum]|uniref:Sec20 C-terminal domain-containing protein n=1 Tax=Hebeloma cylindrosporum TaxID=76867 RepID=A0A0C3CNJ5_HEBCY|nr:hypothetical protein M413DRAFT_442068 [Hebeloma cylindrosporum h7]
MAPIPSRLPEEALSLISAAERRYKHIADTEIPELRKCIGPLSVQQALAEDVREDTIALTQQIETLDMMVDDLQGGKLRKELREIVTDFQKKLERLRKDTRAALLASKRAIDSRAKSNRDELLTFSSAFSEKQTSSEKTTEDLLMKANADVTDGLRRTIALMQTELERSVLSSQILEDSTTTLRSTSSQHDTLSSVMYASKQLVTALEKSDWLDRVLIFSGFFFFIMVVLFILKQRIVDRSIRLAFWWTRFIPSFSDDAALLQSAEKGMAGVVAGATSSLSVVAASLASSILPITTSLPPSSTIVASSSLVGVSATSSVLARSVTMDSFAAPSQGTHLPLENTNAHENSKDAPGLEPEPVHIEL